MSTSFRDGGAWSGDYATAIASLASRTTHGIRLGLQRTLDLLVACGNPHQRLRALHVGGTNGKGSTCATLDAVLRTMGLRTARYSSPHLIDFRERVLIAGRPVSETQVLAWLERHQPDIDALGATFFEATTAMAFDLIDQAGVDVAIIEVGLGGRLDSTNVITPLVSTVTSIGLDHREFLGDTLEAIAREKAGIFKPGVPAVIGEPDPAIAGFLAECARDVGASHVTMVRDAYPVSAIETAADGTTFAIGAAPDSRKLTSSLIGAHQAWNVATAVATLAAAGTAFVPDDATLRRAVGQTRLAGRFQRAGRWIFDVAHNPDGIATVAQTLRAIGPDHPIGAVVCILADKDWRAMLDLLLPVVDDLWLTEAPTAPPGRRWSITDAAAYVEASPLRRCAVHVDGDFDHALTSASNRAATVLVTGSFHTVGDAMLRLQIDPLNG